MYFFWMKTNQRFKLSIRHQILKALQKMLKNSPKKNLLQNT